MSMAGLAGGAARRRRERQLRSFLRHEELSVKMALARALHHSAQPAGPVVGGPEEEVVQGAHGALRGQKTPPPGTQPATLREPGLQLAVEHAACPCSSGVPPLPALGGDCSLDDVAVQFLVAQTLLEREQKALAVKEEEEVLLADLDKREQKLLEEIERYRTTRERGSPGSRVEVAAAWWWVSKTALAKREITASPGRYTNAGPAAPQQLDPGGASDTGHRQAP